MTQQAKALPNKIENLSLLPLTHNVEGENPLLLAVLRSPHTYYGEHSPHPVNTYNK